MKMKLNAFFINHPLLYGTLSGLLLGFILSIIAGLVLNFTPLEESFLSALSIIILILSIFWASKTVSTAIGSKGLIWGLVTGTIFFLITLIFTLIIGLPFSFISIIKKLFFCLLAGALGGIFGVFK